MFGQGLDIDCTNTRHTRRLEIPPTTCGRVCRTFTKMTSAKTAGGKELELDASSGSLQVGKATVTKADIAASNGTIHVIDTVLLPE
jgi:uncharacterized surface protein with fasciclin (FAS1) repeats